MYPGASKEVRLILSSVSLAAVVCIFTWEKYFATPFVESFLIEVADEEFYGRVDSVYNDAPNHNARMALLSDGRKLSVWPEWETKITMGDSLSKKQNSFIIEVYQRSTKKYELDYRVIADRFRDR